jgi:hypothetical protein
MLMTLTISPFNRETRRREVAAGATMPYQLSFETGQRFSGGGHIRYDAGDDVDRTARRKTDDDANRLAGKILRERRAGTHCQRDHDCDSTESVHDLFASAFGWWKFPVAV